MMLARLFYGMARRQQLPAVLGRVHPYTRTPIEATALAGGIVLAPALLVPFERLLALRAEARDNKFAIPRQPISSHLNPRGGATLRFASMIWRSLMDELAPG
jgi:amino acid transporter